MVTAAIVLSTPGPGNRPFVALAYGLMIGVPIAVGLWTWRTRPGNRFGRLLVAAGFLWFVTTLAASSNEVVYSVGRVGAWLVQPLLFVVMLAFPTGTLRTRLDRALVLAGWALIAVLYLPTALVVEQYPVPSPYAPCGVDCPDNAFMVNKTEPAFVDEWLRPLRDLLAVLIFLVVLVVLARRVARASHLMRRALAPVLTVAILLAATFIAYFLVRPGGSGLAGPHGRGVGLRPLHSRHLHRVRGRPPAIAAVRGGHSPAPGRAASRATRPRRAAHRGAEGDHRGSVARARLLRSWAPGRWVDAHGHSVQLPAEGSGRRLTEVRDGDRLVAALVHDAALSDEPEFVQASAALALGALENQRLAAKVDASLRDLRESRARMSGGGRHRAPAHRARPPRRRPAAARRPADQAGAGGRPHAGGSRPGRRASA